MRRSFSSRALAPCGANGRKEVVQRPGLAGDCDQVILHGACALPQADNACRYRPSVQEDEHTFSVSHYRVDGGPHAHATHDATGDPEGHLLLWRADNPAFDRHRDVRMDGGIMRIP